MVVVVVTMGRRIKDAAVLLAVCVLLTQLLHFCFSLLLSSPLSFPFPLLRSCFRVPQDPVWGMSQDSIVQYHETQRRQGVGKFYSGKKGSLQVCPVGMGKLEGGLLETCRLV